jgi:hypothetical protein
MSEKQYLILSGDGPRTHIILSDRAGLEDYIQEHADRHGWTPTFLGSIPDEDGSVEPGHWPEGAELILEVRVVVPQAVTVKWQIP